MNDDFYKYLDAKLTIAMLLNQIYTCYLDLDDYAIKISENNHIFHNYDTLGNESI